MVICFRKSLEYSDVQSNNSDFWKICFQERMCTNMIIPIEDNSYNNLTLEKNDSSHQTEN